MKIFYGSIVVTLGALIFAYFYGGFSAVILTSILAILEISLSFDNAIVNARILEKMSKAWQEVFLTVGILIAVVGMRFIFPLVVVSISANMSPMNALHLALAKGNPEIPGTYGYILHGAHPSIAAFGGLFLLMLALTFFFSEMEHHWLKLPEKLLYKVGQIPLASALISLVVLVFTTELTSKNPHTVLLSGVLGIITFLLVDGLGQLMSRHGALAEVSDEKINQKGYKPKQVTGKAAFVLFLYLEVIDASFSFDGVIGAFAITADPIIIMLGLGLIGAMFVRSLTVFFVEKGTLDELIYIEHGAHWAIMALAVLLLFSINFEISDVITGVLGGIIILLSFASSVIYNRNH
ncbi:DUF475 domain-containing protein [Lactococcus fujiensis]|uniref:Membrane protein n=1 Tax=Lactococcus fujiensis JCM 16395 TaxID=1291764 RepID=A0A2A5RJY6_9LACT|nr:DUF475 domain-containing protein [Lactococcus fujiensis]PCR99518.1 membrane protein [Lactococcus fujiensis JCM 16395]